MKPYLIVVLVFMQLTIKAQLQERIDSLLGAVAQKPRDPGFTVMVVRHDSVLYSRSFGMANAQKKLPISEATIFNIGSVTKQFTAFCILKLELEGKLKRSDLIQKYLPEIPQGSDTITIANLLSHTSGLPDYLEALSLMGENKVSNIERNQMFDYYRTQPSASFAPGSRFSYSNAGYMMLAVIVERVAKMPLADYLKQQVFEPLKMTTATCVLQEQDGLQGTVSYFKVGKTYHHRKIPVLNAVGATGVCCSLNDFRKWDRNFLYPSAETRAIIEEMRKCYRLNDGSSLGYGSGIIVKPYHGYISEEHSGGWNEFMVQFRRIPELELSILIAGNRTDYNALQLCNQITDWCLPPRSDSAFSKLQALPPHREICGTYLDENNLIRKIFIKDGVPVITSYKDTVNELRQFRMISTSLDTTWAIDDAGDTLIFERSGEKISGLYYAGSTYFHFRRHFTKMTFNQADLQSGNFQHEHYNVFLRISKSPDQYFLQFSGRKFLLESFGDGIYKVQNHPVVLRFKTTSTLLIGDEWNSNLKFVKR
ncbi:MAG: serine hydrolase domain-containing protein [Chitinophagales bacterium]